MTKYNFNLNNMNITDVHKKYGINIDMPKSVLKDLDIFDEPVTVKFLDETKRSYECNISCVRGGKSYNCFWCRHSVENTGVQCPIQYNNTQITKTYYSAINKNTYTVNEKVSGKDAKKLMIEPGKYMTDGIFCSFNCMWAYIDSNTHDPLYSNSNNLSLKMYYDMVGKYPNRNPAPHWRKLAQYTGDLSIEEFRESFDRIEYKYQGIITVIPYGHLYERKVKFR